MPEVEQIGELSRRFRSNKSSADHVLRARSKHNRVSVEFRSSFGRVSAEFQFQSSLVNCAVNSPGESRFWSESPG